VTLGLDHLVVCPAATLGDDMNEEALEIMRQDVEENRTAYAKMAEAESVRVRSTPEKRHKNRPQTE
jgi:hypothetical protein